MKVGTTLNCPELFILLDISQEGNIVLFLVEQIERISRLDDKF